MTNFRNKNNAFQSSDSIVWEGEDIPCINLCSGDNISEVIYKLAVEICAMKKSYNLEDLDLQTVFQACIACPQPVKTLQNVLSLIITKVKTMDEIIATLGSGNATIVEDTITLASCFLPRINAEGDPVTKLPHADYTRLIATMVCNTLTTVNGAISRIATVEEDIAYINSAINELGVEPTVSLTCVMPTNAPVAVSVALTALAKDYCAITKVIGDSKSLLKGIGYQQAGLGDLMQLSASNPATMSSITNWVPTVSNMAQFLTNLTLTVNDMRGALAYVVANCCKVSCSSIIVDYGVKLNDERTTASLYFASASTIPTGFNDCDSKGNLLTITDTAGNTLTKWIKVASAATYTVVAGVMTETPIVIDLVNSSIDPSLDYTFTMEACMTNGSMTCTKCSTKTITYKDTCAYCEISVTATTAVNAELVIIYQD